MYRRLLRICVTLYLRISSNVCVAEATQPSQSSASIGSHWLGWSEIDDWFAFGDSWTDVHFDPLGERPSTSNPIGNPKFPGWTSSNGHNYVGYMVSKYNDSIIRLTDFAVSGSVINPDVVFPMFEWLNFGLQVERFEGFNATFNPERSIFSTWFGINDVSCYDKKNPQMDVIRDTYLQRISDLYDLGARNFLMINVPPIDIISAAYPNQSTFPRDVEMFNSMVRDVITELPERYPDITVFGFDVHNLFQQVISDGDFKNSTAACPEYERLKFGLEPAIPSKGAEHRCGAKLEEYLWMDSLHVTWPMHDRIAAVIHGLLTREWVEEGEL